MWNMYYDTTLGFTVFINDQGGTNWLATNMTGQADATWFKFSVEYSNVGTYKMFINGIQQGSTFNIVRDTQKFTSVKNILHMSPDTFTRTRNVYLYDMT